MPAKKSATESKPTPHYASRQKMVMVLTETESDLWRRLNAAEREDATALDAPDNERVLRARSKWAVVYRLCVDLGVITEPSGAQ